jgi:hypothetical protein
MKYLLIALFSFSAWAQTPDLQGFKFKGATLLGGKAFDVYEDQDTTVYKRRTPKSEDPEAKPIPENLINRQTLFEIGFGLGAYSPSDDSLLFRKNGQVGTVSEVLGTGKTTEYTKMVPPFNPSFHVSMHPPVRYLNRFTLGVGVQQFHDAIELSGDPKYHQDHSFTGGTVLQNWNALAEYDLIVFSRDAYGGSAFSAGYSYGHIQMKHWSNGEYVESDPSHEHFANFRLRYLFGGPRHSYEDKATISSGIYLLGRVSNKKTWTFSVGYSLGFGRKTLIDREKVK